MGLERLASHRRVCIDTSLLIYHLEADPVFSEPSRIIFDHFHQAGVHVVTSTITLTELLTKPFRQGGGQRAVQTEQMLQSIPSLTILDVTTDIAREAARLRALHSLRTPDAIQIATALIDHATAFLTNDKGLIRVRDLEVILISEFA